MEVPKWVKESARISAKHYEIARKHNEKLRNWIAKNNDGVEDDYYVDQLIDSTELTNNPELFIEFLEGEEEF